MSRVFQPLWGPWDCCVSLGCPGPGAWQQALGCIWVQEPGNTSTSQQGPQKETSRKMNMIYASKKKLLPCLLVYLIPDCPSLTSTKWPVCAGESEAGTVALHAK